MVDITTPNEILELSDEDFLNMAPPVDTPLAPAPEAEAAAEPGVEAPNTGVDTPADVEVPKEPDTPNEPDTPEGQEPGADGKADEGAAEPGAKEPEAQPKVDSPTGSVAEATPEVHEAFYKQIMAPFKADGRMIQLKSADEAIKLMQMGANYNRKMRDLQPHRKVLTMLQNNDLLDESKLSYLIDLDKRDPQAIKKLIKDAGIDPMDIDTSVEPTYVEGSHRVSDEEVDFNTAIQDLVSAEGGAETLQVIRDKWDQASKDVLWKEPAVMAAIHEQRKNGVYDLIEAEVDRRRLLGEIPSSVSFLQAYKLVGDELAAQQKGTPGPAPVAQPAPEPVATRAAAPKASVENGDKASAASPTRAAPGKATVTKGFLAMSDEEFLKLGQPAG